MSRVELRVSHVVSGLNSFAAQKRSYLLTKEMESELLKADKEPISLTPDEEELYMMFVEDAVLYELCK